MSCLWLSSLVATSCGSRKVTGDLRIDEETRRNIRQIVEEILERRTVEVRTSELNGDIVITRREFDTSGKRDSLTGEYPTSSITDTRIMVTGRDSVTNVDTVSVKERTDATVDSEADIEVRDKTVEERKESSWPKAIIALSVSFCLLVVVYILRKLNIF